MWKSPTVPNVGSAEKMMGQATTMELLYTQTKLNVKSKASDLGGLIYIRPGMARVPSSSFCKFSLKWIAILWKQKPNERGLPKQRYMYHRYIDYHRSNHYTQRYVYKTSSLATVPSKEKTKVSIAESADRSSHFLQMKKNEVSAPFISGFNKLMSISMHYYSSWRANRLWTES